MKMSEVFRGYSKSGHFVWNVPQVRHFTFLENVLKYFGTFLRGHFTYNVMLNRDNKRGNNTGNECIKYSTFSIYKTEYPVKPAQY